jgi:hypothetical protein
MLSNFQIAEIAKDLSIKLPLENIVMKNELKSPKIANYVVNLQSDTEGNGTHWTALIIEDKDSFFFDSFGALPSLEIIQFCRKRKGDHHLYFNNWIIQDLRSELCGWYCLGLLFYVKIYRSKFTSLTNCCNAYINLFKDETEDNADVLKEYFQGYRFKYRNLLMKSD